MKLDIKNAMRILINFIYTSYELERFHRATPHRLKMLKTAISYLKSEKVNGDYFELGVARGLTFISAFHLARQINPNIEKFYAFDSFEGFPEPKGKDKKFERFKKGQENWSIELFKRNLKRKKVDLNKVVIKKGWFKDTLNENLKKELLKKNTKIALAWIDCDLYQSSYEVLMFIRPFITQGTVIVFDDWLCYRGDPNKGEQRAAKEFLKQFPDVQLIPFKRFGIVGNSFIVNIKGKD